MYHLINNNDTIYDETIYLYFNINLNLKFFLYYFYKNLISVIFFNENVEFLCRIISLRSLVEV